MAEFNIMDVVRIHNIQSKKKGAEYSFVCPSCYQSGACTYNPVKGNWHCWKCDAGGGPIELHIAETTDAEALERYSGPEGKKHAARDIFKAIGEDISFHSSEEKVAPIVEAEKASDEHCSRVYSAILRECTLSDKHCQRLLDRGFTEEQIVRFKFKSLPDDTKALARNLLRKGYVLEGVPGFFTYKGEWDFKIPYNHRLKRKETGTFCPVFDGERNLLLGFQVNVDKPEDWDKLTDEDKYDYTKYLWISSKGKENGVSSGSIATFLPGKGDSNAVILTEGILKATVIYCLLGEEVSVIGVPGVSVYKSAIPYVERFNTKTVIFTAYDMDKEYTKDMLHLKDKPLTKCSEAEAKYKRKIERINSENLKLKDMLTEYGLSVHELSWDIKEGIWNGGYKGLDDFLHDYDRKDLFIKFLGRKSHELISQEFLTKLA